MNPVRQDRHVGAAVVIRMDIKDFFTATTAKRLRQYFQRLGWDAVATDCLLRLTTYKGSLPQGAPTSPRLSNLVNYRLDARLAGLAGRCGASYTRYADDLTFSFAALPDRSVMPDVIRVTKKILGQYGYRLHQRRKLHIRRRHQRQIVTGLVVNHRAALPRATRRRLRAVEHHLAAGQRASLTERQLAGWRALQHMIEIQSGPAPSN
ncbi:MAG: RNA-directed DNA polymerase [Sedimentisphaerales bacterium]|nr:RNA-directed DNA polymerase [Sedimentisphaerales bacterium]